MKNAVVWSEIAVSDLRRATAFYEKMLDGKLKAETFGPYEFALFPHAADGVGGCLMKGEGYEPSANGTVTYLAAEPGIDAALKRTVYRDVRDLSLSGVPVEGEAGVGYRLRAGFDVPPLMFTLNEIEALAVGARMVEAWGGPVLAESARTAIEKIVAALPADRRAAVDKTRLYAPAFHVDGRSMRQLESVREAIGSRRVLRLDYCDSGGKPSERNVWPLALYYWGRTWTIGAWCERREDFRNFRVDRIAGLETLERRYPDEAGKRLADFIRAMEAH